MKRLALGLLVLVGAMFSTTLLWGQEYGAVLDDTEQQAMSETFQYALENNRTNEASAWVNPDTEHTGSVVPVRTYQNAAGQYCREFVTTIIVGGVEEPAYGTACRQPDGAWVIVPTDLAPEQQVHVERVVERQYVYPYAYRYWYADYPYYYYPDAWFYPSRIFFSFNIVHFSRTPHFKHSRVYFPHSHVVHRFPGRKDFHRKSHDGIIRSHRGGVSAGYGDSRLRKDVRRSSDDRVFRGSGSRSGAQRFQGRPESFRRTDQRALQSGGRSQDIQGRRDLRNARPERTLRGTERRSHSQRLEGRFERPERVERKGLHSERNIRRDFSTRPEVRDRHREFRGTRDYRGRSDFQRERSFDRGSRSSGDRSYRGGRQGR